MYENGGNFGNFGPGLVFYGFGASETYQFQVMACEGDFQSDVATGTSSSVDCASRIEPSVASQLTKEFNPSNNNSREEITGYNIYRGPVSQAYDLIDSVDGNTTEYLDSNLTSCKNFIFKKIFENKSLTMQTNKHPKSDLQEITLKYFKFMPTYELIKKTGPDHNPNFLVKVKINDKLYSQSEGKNIQIAEQNAAKKLIPNVKKNIKYDKNKI